MSSDDGRNQAPNRQTVGLVGLRSETSLSYKRLFVRNYDHIKDLLVSFEDAGVLSIAVDIRKGEIESSLWSPTTTDKPTVAIIGRHGEAGLYLGRDTTVSLRHLALVVEPAQSWNRDELDVAFHIRDLRTGVGFHDEEGRTLGGLRAEGPAMIRCGGYALFFLPTGDRLPWPERAKDGWDSLPERVYQEERTEPGKKRRREIPAAPNLASINQSLLQRTLAPLSLDNDLLRPDETAVGEIRLRTSTRRSSFSVGPAALAEGILLGRYERCERASVLVDARISRVHLLIMSLAGQPWAMDVASTSGTWRIGESGRLVTAPVTRLEDGEQLILADRVAELRWFSL